MAKKVNGSAVLPTVDDLMQLNVSVSVEHITQEMAFELLGNNWEGQRDPRYKRAAQYAADMRNGLWRPAVATIDIDVNGKVINGQHVLSAIFETGLAQYCTVRRGMPTSAYQAIDQHGARSFKDVLQAAGVVRHETISSFVGRSAQVATYGRYGDGGAQLSTAAKLRLWGEIGRFTTVAGHSVHPVELIPAADVMNKKFNVGSGFALSVLYFCAVSDPEKDGGLGLVNAFADKLVKGVDLSEHSPVYLLREFLNARKGMRTERPSLSSAAAKTFRAWNAWLEGSSPTRLIGVTSTGTFPLPSDPHGNLAKWRKQMAPIVEVPYDGFSEMKRKKRTRGAAA